MGQWGIAKIASKKEKLKSKFADYVHGLNSTGEINYVLYSKLFDFGMDLLDEMYELGKEASGVIQEQNKSKDSSQ